MLEDKKILILREKDTQYFLKYVNNTEIEGMYKKRNTLICKILFKLFYKLDNRLLDFFFEDWKKSICNYTDIIIFDSAYRSEISRFIKRKNKNCKIIFYFWNIVKPENKNFLKDKNIDEFWTFDNQDSMKYGLKLNKQFYSKEVKIEQNKNEIDIYFLGKDKGRKEYILNFEKIAKEKNIITKFTILQDNDSKLISYDEYLKEIGKSKAILDILDKNQSGLTLRTLEALFLKKKLITTNNKIKKYDFYNAKNIFIIGEDDIEYLKEFLESEYEPISRKIVEDYDFESWKKRFFI